MGKAILILRFRDLFIKTPGHTIAEHKKVIEEHGYAWWGWWKKQSERVPAELWADLIRDLRAAGQGEIYLLDSGQRKLYHAELLDLQFKPGVDDMAAPDNGEKTPAYYRTIGSGQSNPFASWFKIRNIDEVDEKALHDLVYATVPADDFARVIPDQILNRRIERIGDLLLFGNVTYWLSKRASADSRPSGPIDVRIPPALAPDDVVTARSPFILHLSDLHYGGHHAFAATDADDEANPSMARAVKNALDRYPDSTPGVVVVTGDLTWKGSPEEFDAAFAGLDRLRSWLGLTRQHFVIIPGNHDLGWIRSGDQAWSGEYRVVNETARSSYEDFFKRWYETAPDKDLRIGRRFFLHGGPSVDVLGFNSSSLQQVEGELQGLGLIPDKHYDEAAAEMGWSPSGRRPTRMRLVLTHHHLLPVVDVEEAAYAKRGFGIALDAGQQLRLASHYGVDLVVHGHQHHPFAGYFLSANLAAASESEPRQGVWVIGGGSAGVKNEDIGPIQHRCFGLINMDDDTIRYQLFATAGGPNRFERQWTVQTKGGGWTRETERQPQAR